jgi:hypothetical protein
MKSKTQNFSTCLSTILFFLITIINVAVMDAQSKITSIRFNGQNVSTANTTVMPPGQSSRPQINTGDVLPSGTRLIIPYGVVLILQSPGGRQICGSTIQGKSMDYTVKITSQGESHTVRGQGAQISNTVTRSTNYNYRVNNGHGVTSAAKLTAFTFKDMSEGKNGDAVISTQEGVIHIIDEVPVTIGGQVKTNKQGKPLTKAIAQTQSANDGEYYSTDNPVNYSDYNQAIQDVAEDINSIVDLEERADNLLCLGDLYMDDDQPSMAIDPYYKAYQILNDYYGPDDLDTLDAILCVADALEYSDRTSEADSYIAHARSILKEIHDMDVEDLNYLIELGYYDSEDIYAICDELSDIYDLLGWSYDIKGDEYQSKKYYDLSDTVCND